LVGNFQRFTELVQPEPIHPPDYCLSFPCIVILIPKNVKNTTTKINPIIIDSIFLIFCSQDRTRTCIKLHIEWVST